MCRLPYPMQGGKGTAFDFRSYPSLAPDLVAGLQDLPKGTAGPCSESSGTGVKVGTAGKAERMGHEVLEPY